MLFTEEMVSFICAFFNDKGGVAKTTMVAEGGAILARLGVPTVVMDLDWRGDLTKFFIGDDERGVSKYFTLHDQLALTCLFQDFGSELPDPHDIICAYERLPNLMYLPINLGFKLIESTPQDKWPMIQQRLAEFILEVKRLVPVVLLDCPPNFSFGSWIALLAADYVVSPCTPERWAVTSLHVVESHIAEAAPHRAANRPPLTWLGPLPTKVDAILGSHSHWLEQMQLLYPTTANGGTFPLGIPERAAFKNACDKGVLLGVRHRESEEVLAVLDFVVEMMKRARFEIPEPLLTAKGQRKNTQEEVIL